jgi:hypothetical protein
MVSALDILARIEPLTGSAGFAEAARFLKSSGVRYHIGGGSNTVTASAVAHAWSTRLYIARRKGREPVLGCEHLVTSVTALPKATALEYRIFERGSDIACFWFVEATAEPVGFVVGQAHSCDEALP